MLTNHDYATIFTENFELKNIDKELQDLSYESMPQIIDYVMEALDQDLKEFSSSERKMIQLRAKIKDKLSAMLFDK